MNLVQNYSDHFGNSQRSSLSPTEGVKSTSPTTENGYENCTYSMNNNTSDEDNHDSAQVLEHQHAQVAPVSTARRARSSVHFLMSVSHAPHGSRCS